MTWVYLIILQILSSCNVPATPLQPANWHMHQRDTSRVPWSWHSFSIVILNWGFWNCQEALLIFIAGRGRTCFWNLGVEARDVVNRPAIYRTAQEQLARCQLVLQAVGNPDLAISSGTARACLLAYESQTVPQRRVHRL